MKTSNHLWPGYRTLALIRYILLLQTSIEDGEKDLQQTAPQKSILEH